MELHDFISEITKSLQALHKPLLSENKYSSLGVTQYSEYTTVNIYIFTTEATDRAVSTDKLIHTYEPENPEEQRRILSEIDELFPI